MGDNLLLSLCDEKIKAAHISKNCRVFLFSCFTKSSEQLPTYFGQINYLSDFIYRTQITVTPYKLEKFDAIKLGAKRKRRIGWIDMWPCMWNQFTPHTIIQQSPESTLNMLPTFWTSFSFPSGSLLNCGDILKGENDFGSRINDWALIKMNPNRVGENFSPLDPLGGKIGNTSIIHSIEPGDTV